MSVRSMHNCPAPAKLNLFLHVTGRRADGYHLLQTVFQLIDYGDVLHFDIRDDGVIRRITDVPGIAHDDDLIVRAAALLQSIAKPRMNGKRLGADITIDKRLPMGGGLGGGSSDAATTLLVLNHLWDTGLSRAELMKLGLQLGADVPFFLFGKNAFAEGIGETLMPLSTPDRWFIVIEPGVSVPTAAIFNASQLTRDTKLVKITDFSEGIEEFGKNDLQDVASSLYPPIAEAVNWLSQYGKARMTGSGACVFCPIGGEAEADKILERVPEYWKAWKARSLPEHPLEYLLKS